MNTKRHTKRHTKRGNPLRQAVLDALSVRPMPLEDVVSVIEASSDDGRLYVTISRVLRDLVARRLVTRPDGHYVSASWRFTAIGWWPRRNHPWTIKVMKAGRPKRRLVRRAG